MEHKKRPLIFISNDDGYCAKGLAILINIVSKYGDVIVVAPESARSGMSHAITISTPIRLNKIKDEENLKIYKCSGTPVDCVKLGFDKLLPRKPDIMVSGINHGSNASISIIYSGTMGAATEACLNGIPSIGFSLLDHSSDADFTPCIEYVDHIFQHVLKNSLPPYTTLNVNIPKRTTNEIKGVKVCRQTHGIWKEEFEHRIDPQKQDYYWLTGSFINFESDAKDTDEWALSNGYVAVVPVKADFTAYHVFEDINALNKENTDEKKNIR